MQHPRTAVWEKLTCRDCSHFHFSGNNGWVPDTSCMLSWEMMSPTQRRAHGFQPYDWLTTGSARDKGKIKLPRLYERRGSNNLGWDLFGGVLTCTYSILILKIAAWFYRMENVVIFKSCGDIEEDRMRRFLTVWSWHGKISARKLIHSVGDHDMWRSMIQISWQWLLAMMVLMLAVFNTVFFSSNSPNFSLTISCDKPFSPQYYHRCRLQSLLLLIVVSTHINWAWSCEILYSLVFS